MNPATVGPHAYVVTHRTPGREGSGITRVKTYARAVSRARKHVAAHNEPVAVWSDKTEQHLLFIDAQGNETKES